MEENCTIGYQEGCLTLNPNLIQSRDPNYLLNPWVIFGDRVPMKGFLVAYFQRKVVGVYLAMTLTN